MTSKNPVVLDIVITKITKKTIYYNLTANQKAEKWCIPTGSTFDKSQLIVGERYRVTSTTIPDKVWVFKKHRHLRKERFDWLTATKITPVAKLQARSTKQRQACEAMAALPFVDNGSLFIW